MTLQVAREVGMVKSGGGEEGAWLEFGRPASLWLPTKQCCGKGMVKEQELSHNVGM